MSLSVILEVFSLFKMPRIPALHTGIFLLKKKKLNTKDLELSGVIEKKIMPLILKKFICKEEEGNIQ